MFPSPPSERLIAVGLAIAALVPAAMPHRAEGQNRGDLGVVSFPVSCTAAAQAEFDRAVALLHHMTYPEAQRAFRRVGEIDPQCAMAHWGIAMTLFQPLWPTRPGPAELRLGWQAVLTARDLQPPTERERLFVDAAAAFFEQPESTDYWRRIARWEQAMAAVYAAFPEDPEATAFYALAHLAVAASGELDTADRAYAATLLEGLYESNPEHPGVLHYLTHASDANGHERDYLDAVRRYESVAPRNPHALHMPTHIYTRLGDWDAVIRGNLLAAEAALEHPAGEHGEFVWDEFPHAIEYLVYANLQKGADDEAGAQLRRLLSTERLQPGFKTAFHLASSQARYALERRSWPEAAATLPGRPPTVEASFPWPEAIGWFARGLGAVHLGELEKAAVAAARIDELENVAATAGEALFARNIRILGLELGAWIAHAELDRETAVNLLEQAAELEVSTPKHAVTPGPTLPAHELLGDLQLEQQRPADALTAYRRSLELYPRRLNSLLGAARAARALDEAATARTFYRLVLEVGAGGSRQSALAEARAYLDQSRQRRQ